MTAPIPNSHRTDYFDRDGWVYDTFWGVGQPPEANAVGNVVPVNNTEPGQSPLGDCTRTTVYDDRGEPIHTVWNPCPPAVVRAGIRGRVEPGRTSGAAGGQVA